MRLFRIWYIRPTGAEGWRDIGAESEAAAVRRFRWIDDAPARVFDVEPIRA